MAKSYRWASKPDRNRRERLGGFVVIVDSCLKPGAMGAFRRLMDENARTSARDEAGCRQFDVVVPDGDQHPILLHEVYDDMVAFERHKQSSYFADFDRFSAPLLTSKTVTFGQLVFAGATG
ncbi:MAG: putative quinol monooxygenase [Dongiaceae bacterium]